MDDNIQKIRQDVHPKVGNSAATGGLAEAAKLKDLEPGHKASYVTKQDQPLEDDDAATTIVANKKEAAKSKTYSSSSNENKSGGNKTLFDHAFFEQAIERYRRGREEAASSSSMREAMAAQGVANARITNSQGASKSNVISNSSGSNATTSDDHSPSPNDESETSTNSERDKTSRNSSDVDGEKPTNDDQTEEVIVNMEKKKKAEQDAKKAAAVVSEESGSSGDKKNSTKVSSSLTIQTGTESKSTASDPKNIDLRPSKIIMDKGDDEQEDGEEEEEEEDDEDAEAREAVGTLLGMHEFASHRLKPPPSSAASSKASSRSAKGPAENRKHPHSSDQELEVERQEDHSPLKKRRYQKRGTTEDATPTEGMSELEKKRLASRISSRRTREREKMRGEYFRTIRKKLEKKNRKLRDENTHIRILIKKTKREIANSKKGSSSAAVLPLIVGSDSSVPAASPSTIPQGQDQVLLLLLQQLVGNGNHGSGNNDSQSPLQNPVVLALLVVALQNQGQNSQSIPTDVLLKLLQAVLQQQPQSQNSLPQQLLPLLLAAQGGGNTNNLSWQQQLILQLLPLLMSMGQQGGGESQHAQSQQQQEGNNVSNVLQQLLTESLSQAPSNSNAPSLGSQSSAPAASMTMQRVPQTSQVSMPSIATQPQALQASAAKAPAPAAMPQQLSAPATQPVQQNPQPFPGMIGSQAKATPVQAGLNSTQPQQDQMQQLAMMMARQGQQMTPQMQQQLLAMMSMQQGNSAAQLQQGFIGQQAKAPVPAAAGLFMGMAGPLAKPTAQQTAQLQRPYANQAQPKPSQLDSSLNSSSGGMRFPPNQAAPQQNIQQMQMHLQQLQAQQQALSNQSHGSKQIPEQQQMQNGAFLANQMHPNTTLAARQSQSVPNMSQAQLMMMQPQEMQKFVAMIERGGIMKLPNFFPGNGSAGGTQ